MAKISGTSIFSLAASWLALWPGCQLSSALVLPNLFPPPTQSQPNPIYSMHAVTDVTGTINTTLVVVPIPLAEARARIPSAYGILTAAYLEQLPGWPSDMYPLVLTSTIDHDVRGFGVGIPDFTNFRISFPFVDILGDGYSNFLYAPFNWISLTPVGILGLTAYGVPSTVVATDPQSDPYEFVKSSQANAPGEVYFNFTEVGASKSPTGYLKLAPAPADIPFSFTKNVTNQPITGSGILCDNQVRYFNTPLTKSLWEPISVAGSAFIDSPLYPYKINSNKAKGWLFAAAFLENNFIPCPQLKGYTLSGAEG